MLELILIYEKGFFKPVHFYKGRENCGSYDCILRKHSKGVLQVRHMHRRAFRGWILVD